MLTMYIPVAIMMIVGVILGVAPLLISKLLAKRRPSSAKLSTYECGFEPFGDARMPFDVRFYLVAILFIVFDLETAFLFPWAVALRDIGWAGMGSMGIFLGILVIGFLYEWRTGALTWE